LTCGYAGRLAFRLGA